MRWWIALVGIILSVQLAYGQFSDTDFIIKTVDQRVAEVGDTLTYSVTFHNPKDTALTQVVVIDYFDARLDNLSIVASSPVGSSIISGNTIITQDFDLQPGATYTITVRARISDRANPDDLIASAATLESPEESIHLSNRVETRVVPTRLPRTGALGRAAWLLWNLVPIVILISVGGLVVVSLRTRRRRI